MRKLTPIIAIRMHCRSCWGGELKEVRLCPTTECSLWLYRLGKRPTERQLEEWSETNDPEEKPTPIRAIRKRCFWCCNESNKSIRLCQSITCPVWPYRMGHRPTEEELTQWIKEHQEEAAHQCGMTVDAGKPASDDEIKFVL